MLTKTAKPPSGARSGLRLEAMFPPNAGFEGAARPLSNMLTLNFALDYDFGAKMLRQAQWSEDRADHQLLMRFARKLRIASISALI
jgi:hypothetical protein